MFITKEVLDPVCSMQTRVQKKIKNKNALNTELGVE